MARTAEQNAAMREATREAIEDAAVRVFATRGFAASNIRHIAAESGLSAGSIYRHYASKEALFDALLNTASRGVQTAAQTLSSDAEPLTLVRGFTRILLTDLASGGSEAAFYLVLNHAVLTDTPRGSAARLAGSQRALWDAFAALIARGQAFGQFVDGDPHRLTAYYFAMLSGAASMRTLIPDGITEQDVDLVLRLLTEMR